MRNIKRMSLVSARVPSFAYIGTVRRVPFMSLTYVPSRLYIVCMRSATSALVSVCGKGHGVLSDILRVLYRRFAYSKYPLVSRLPGCRAAPLFELLLLCRWQR